MKHFIIFIDEINFDKIFETIWVFLYIINTSIVWLGWIWIKDNPTVEMIWTFNLAASLIIGVLGILTFFGPFILLAAIWEKLVDWARGDFK